MTGFSSHALCNEPNTLENVEKNITEGQGDIFGWMCYFS